MQCKRSTSDGTRGWSTATRRGRCGLSVCLCSWCQRRRWGRGGAAGRPQGRVAAAASHVSSSSSSQSKVRAVLFYDHARAEREGQHGATCACMRVVLCRLWVLNVWLLCTHTHTHTSACTLTAAAAATACTVGCACVREHTRAFPRTSC